MRATPRTTFFFIAAVVAVFALGRGMGSPDATSRNTVAEAPDPGSLSWGACAGEDAPEAPLECASIRVPMSYAEPEGKSLSVAMVRVPATTSKRGIILVNPGGPGGSGFDFVASEGQSMVSTLELQSYDLIGFDPRGVDRSDAVKCQTDAEMDKYLYVDPTPDTPAEKTLYDEAENAFAEACARKYGETLKEFSTENTARDMDQIRRAMGEERLNYIGISYGTYLGGVYATLFPESTGALYLDGAFDPAGDTVEQQYTTQAEGFEKAFNNWASDCEGNTGCAFHAADVGARWDALLERLDEEPIISEGGREVNNAVLRTATTAALYSKGSWSALSSALAAAEDGRGDQLLRLADSYNQRSEDGTFSSLMQSFPVIQCASGMGSPAPKDPEALVAKLREVAPRRSRDVTADDFDSRECDGLMEDPDIIEISYDGDAPIVVVGGKNDPATPFRWAEEMAANLGGSARLVAYTGEGHGQILMSKCVDAISRALFSAEAELPENGTVCDPDPPVSRPAWWSDIPAPGPGETVIAREVGDGYVGMTETQIYSEYRAVPGSVAGVAESIARRLRAAGFTPQGEVPDDPTKQSQYFDKDGEVLGALVFAATDLKKNGFAAPEGPVPAGEHLVVYFYFPPAQ